MTIKLLQGDCLDILPTLEAESIHAVITDPPYNLSSEKKGGTGVASLNVNSPAGRSRISTGFMGHVWDNNIAMRPETWREVLRVLKPGGHLLAFGGTRTYHRMACAIEDAGFEVRDTLMWLYASGFPKGLDIGKAIDKSTRGVPQGKSDPTSPNHGKYKSGCSEDNSAGRGFGAGPGSYMAEAGIVTKPILSGDAQSWQGWNTSLKPCYEPIILARKELDGNVVGNVLQHSTGGINIDACRVPINPEIDDPRLGGNGEWSTAGMAKNAYGKFAGTNSQSSELGRFPGNIIHDGSEQVRTAFPKAPGASAPVLGTEDSTTGDNGIFGHYNRVASMPVRQDIDTSAARFYYCAKASASERQGSRHPTIKPVALMRYLCKLITPPNGMILDLFAGSGTTGQAAVEEGFNVTLIEREDEYCADIRRRLIMYLDETNE